MDKELHLWVTYPAVKQAKRKVKRTKSRREPPKLWAVVIIEALQQTGAFTYEVTLRRIFKRDERTIKVRVSNDPDNQSEEAMRVRNRIAACGAADVAGAIPKPSGRQEGL